MGADLKTLFQKMPVPRFIVVAEKDSFTVMEANDLALKYFDLSKEQIVGKSIDDFMDEENVMHFHQSFEVCYSKKRAVTIQALPGVPGNVRVHGFYITPIMGEDGEIAFLDAIGQVDVADQSMIQRERDDAISLLTSIFEVSDVGIIVTDNNARIVRVNDSFLRTYGWPREELINTNFISLVTPDERNWIRKSHEKFIYTGARSSGELKIIRKDGSIANALFTTATLELSQKRRYQVTTVMDITLRKQMEESLRLAKDQADAANRAKSTFLASMSHELRTPLNAIIGFSEMMIKETFGALGHKKYGEYLGDIHVSAQHLLEIINEVLDMSKIEAGRIELDESEVDVKELLKAVMRMMASRAFGNNLTLDVDIQADMPNVFADERLLRQVFINLINNAIKFSYPGGHVDVAAYTLEDGRVQITIADEGRGIPKDRIKQAMEPFTQVTADTSENAKNQGTGLGLPLAKAMIDLHDGSLELESEEDEGTKVFVMLPAHRIIKPASKKSPYSKKAEEKPDAKLAQQAK